MRFFPFSREHRRRALIGRRRFAPGAIPWGTDLSTIAPTVLNANADVAVTAGVTTTAIHSQSGGVAVPLIQTNPIDCYPIIWGNLAILLGATPPTALVISYATVSGTAIASYTFPPALLLANATAMVPIFLVGPLSATLYTGAGKDPLVQVNATGQAVTVKAVGSAAIFELVLGVE
jgi:hypothetical protein